MRSTLLVWMALVSASTGACLASVDPIPFAVDVDATVPDTSGDPSEASANDTGGDTVDGESNNDAIATDTQVDVFDAVVETQAFDAALDAGVDGSFDAPIDTVSQEAAYDGGNDPLSDAATTDALVSDAPTDAGSWNVYPSDVSILFPLPALPSELIGADAAGAHGALLPRSSYAKMIYSTEVDGGRVDRPLDAQQPDSTYENLRLVSVRLDPCSKRNTATCRTEVRAVLQTVAKLPGGSVVVHDGAVHIFYDVPELELVSMLREILVLRNAQSVMGVFPSVNGLGVHPTLEAQGAAGPFASGLRTILLSHIGNARIGRITFFDADISNDPTWVFRSFDYVAGSPVQVVLPHFGSRGGALEQVVFGSFPFISASNSGVNGFAIPSSDAPDNVEGLSDLPRPAKGQPANAKALAAFAAAERIQDPEVHNSESIDCSNCHLAEGAMAVGKTQFSLLPTLSQKLKALDTRYVRQDDAVTNLHAFGYLGRNVSVMQRTANESAFVAKTMQTML